MRGHQTRYCRAYSIFSIPKWPPNTLSCSSQSTISWKPTLSGSISTSESFSTLYKAGCSPLPCKQKCPLLLCACTIKGESLGSKCYECDTQGSQSGLRTTVCRQLSESGTIASQPGQYSKNSLHAERNSIQHTWWGDR